MANRPVFLYDGNKVVQPNIEFKWCGVYETSLANITSNELHKSFKEQYPDTEVLEASTASGEKLGVALSAFNLRNPIGYTVEQIYQSSKVFENGGPYYDILGKHSAQAKKDSRLRESGKLAGFRFNGNDYDLEEPTAYFNYLYIHTLMHNDFLYQQLDKYNAFTDIYFNPEKGKSCQAHALAVFKMLVDSKELLNALGSFSNFKQIVYKGDA